MSPRFIALRKFLYYSDTMMDEPEYIGVTVNEQGVIALTLFYDSGDCCHIYLEDEDVIRLIASLITATTEDRECQTHH